METAIVITPEQLGEVLKRAVLGALEEFNANSQDGGRRKELPENINIDQAVEFLSENGYPTAKSQIYKFTSAGEIPHRKYGSVLVFNRTELLRWAESRTKNHIAGHEDAVLSVARSARNHKNR